MSIIKSGRQGDNTATNIHIGDRWAHELRWPENV